VGCLILQNTLGLSKSWLALGGLVFLFWPSGWIHSARIGNDVPFYLCHTLSFYFLLKSRAKLGESADPQLLWATAWAVLGCFFKISGVFSLLIIGLLILPRLLPRRNSSSQQPRPWPAVGVICVTLALLTWMTLVLKEGTLFKSNQLGASLLVQTNFETILGFDFHSYFHAPFLNSTLDSTGRQTFLNYFLKSSLFGEFNFKAPLQLAIAPILSTLLLVVLALAGVGALCTKKCRLNHHGLHALHLLAGVVTTLSYRAFAPYACNADFRYLYPMVISLTCFAVHGVQVLAQNKNKTAAGIGTLTLVMFATLSAVFYVSL
jgi:hypothetical protein